MGRTLKYYQDLMNEQATLEKALCEDHRDCQPVTKGRITSLIEKTIEATRGLTNVIRRLSPQPEDSWEDGLEILIDTPSEKYFWEDCSICCCQELLVTVACDPFLVGLHLTGEERFFERCLAWDTEWRGDKDIIRKRIDSIVAEIEK
jgi:hypothetical protein